jgi:ribose 1,5-bisphosphokinase PhnN
LSQSIRRRTGREERLDERIDRLAQGGIESKADLVIDNVGDPTGSGEKLLAFLQALAAANG